MNEKNNQKRNLFERHGSYFIPPAKIEWWLFKARSWIIVNLAGGSESRAEKIIGTFKAFLESILPKDTSLTPQILEKLRQTLSRILFTKKLPDGGGLSSEELEIYQKVEKLLSAFESTFPDFPVI